MQVIRLTETPVPAATSTVPPTITPSPTIFTPGPTPTPFMTQTPGPTETPQPTLNMPYEDVSGLLQGVCFKYLAALDGQMLTFDSPGDLNAFYNAVNDSKKCIGPVQRRDFDFSNKQAILLIAVDRPPSGYKNLLSVAKSP